MGVVTQRINLLFLTVYCGLHKVRKRIFLKIEVFWVLTPYSVAVGYQRFRGQCFLNPEDLDFSPP
jgi:hypothetical protein